MFGACMPAKGTGVAACDLGALDCHLQAVPIEDSVGADGIYPSASKWADSSDVHYPTYGTTEKWTSHREMRMSLGEFPPHHDTPSGGGMFSCMSGNDPCIADFRECSLDNCKEPGGGAFFVYRAPKMFLPCCICAAHPATVVEVPCGHVTVCEHCVFVYRHNPKCLVCRQDSQGRVDVHELLSEGSGPSAQVGSPPLCNSCLEKDACVLVLPCKHMTLCEDCFKKDSKGCPACGEPMDESSRVTALWRLGRKDGAKGPTGEEGSVAVYEVPAGKTSASQLS